MLSAYRSQNKPTVAKDVAGVRIAVEVVPKAYIIGKRGVVSLATVGYDEDEHEQLFLPFRRTVLNMSGGTVPQRWRPSIGGRMECATICRT